MGPDAESRAKSWVEPKVVRKAQPRAEIEAELRTEPRVEQRVAPRLQSAGVVQAGAETAAKAVAKPKDEGQPKAANKKDRYDNGR